MEASGWHTKSSREKKGEKNPCISHSKRDIFFFLIVTSFFQIDSWSCWLLAKCKRHLISLIMVNCSIFFFPFLMEIYFHIFMVENKESSYIASWNLLFPYFWGILHIKPNLMQVYNLAYLNIAHKWHNRPWLSVQGTHDFNKPKPPNSKPEKIFSSDRQLFTGLTDLNRIFIITSNQIRDYFSLMCLDI